ETKNAEEKAAKQALLKQCEQLIARNERIKKNIADDMAACRYTEGKTSLDPIKIAGFLIGAPVTLATMTKTFVTDKPEMIWHAGEAGVALGLLAAFHRQANSICKHSVRIIAGSPKQMVALWKSTRMSIFATALTLSVTAKCANDIEPRHPTHSKGAKVVIDARYNQ
ncbi:MAG: hypothetical protein KGI97_07215, partial [Alphaproteobacteria bacterium]|nr:hypothetical protein [Alphaproteobacteria bacterium]